MEDVCDYQGIRILGCYPILCAQKLFFTCRKMYIDFKILKNWKQTGIKKYHRCKISNLGLLSIVIFLLVIYNFDVAWYIWFIFMLYTLYISDENEIHQDYMSCWNNLNTFILKRKYFFSEVDKTWHIVLKQVQVGRLRRISWDRRN